MAKNGRGRLRVVHSLQEENSILGTIDKSPGKPDSLATVREEGDKRKRQEKRAIDTGYKGNYWKRKDTERQRDKQTERWRDRERDKRKRQ